MSQRTLSGDCLVKKLYALSLLSFKDGSTALFKAAFKGHNSVIEELLKFSPSLGLLKVEDATLRRTILVSVC